MTASATFLEGAMDRRNSVFDSVNAFAGGPPMLGILGGTGVLLTLGLVVTPWHKVGYGFRLLFDKSRAPGEGGSGGRPSRAAEGARRASGGEVGARDCGGAVRRGADGGGVASLRGPSGEDASAHRRGARADGARPPGPGAGCTLGGDGKLGHRPQGADRVHSARRGLGGEPGEWRSRPALGAR